VISGSSDEPAGEAEAVIIHTSMTRTNPAAIILFKSAPIPFKSLRFSLFLPRQLTITHLFLNFNRRSPKPAPLSGKKGQ